ncbi:MULTISPECIES: bifunctional RNase H/acid phosphatase [unclassified Janibacter]|uniref:bifunctional RNase H/acid phosphatase n=1 Tax=unclassified Janibacter TaxID=2649294 RepID=UPI003CFEDA32
MSARRRLRVEADGGSRGNPGVAGYGALVRDAVTGELLVERAAPLGKASNNVAEYRGLIAALDAARAIDPSADVEAAMDSKLVVEQMSGRWKIKHPDMRELALEARDIAADISAAGGSVTYLWIPRAQNSDADLLSNKGMDGLTIDTLGDDVPEVPDDDRLEMTAEESLPAPPPATGRPEGEPTRIVLVRHGVTVFTEQGRLDGRGGADPSLSPAGRAQAEGAARAAVHLIAGREVRVVTSELARAKETGAVIAEALGVTPVTDAAFDEQSFGDWDGASARELMAGELDAFERLRSDLDYARPGGESHREMTSRVVEAFEALVAGGGTVVVVCHRKPIMAVLGHVLGIGDPSRLWRLAAAPGSLTAIEAWPGGEAIVAFTNRT